MEKELLKQIGERVRYCREDTGYTREQFAEKAGISPQFLAEIENGKKGMSAETLYRLCDAFYLSADYLLFGLEPDEDDRSYEERLDEPYMRFEKAVEKYDKSQTSELLDLCNEVSSETASVYMEIGLQAGILLMVDVVKKLQ